jgi:hypothetical protein
VRLTIYSKPFVPKLQVFFKAHPKDSVGKITMFLNHLFCNKNHILFLCFFSIPVCLHTCVPNGCAAGDKMVSKRRRLFRRQHVDRVQDCQLPCSQDFSDGSNS